MNGIERKITNIEERMYEILNRHKYNRSDPPPAFYLGRMEHRQLEIMFMDKHGIDISEREGYLIFRGVKVYEVDAKNHLTLATEVITG